MPDKSATVQWPGAQALVLEMACDRGFSRARRSAGAIGRPPKLAPTRGDRRVSSQVSLSPEPHQPRDGLHPDSARDAGLGQHAVLGEIPPGHLHPGKGWGQLPSADPPSPASPLPPSRPLFPCRSSWRTVAEKTSTSAPLAVVRLSSPRCCVRSCRSGNCVSARLPARPFLGLGSPVRPEGAALGVPAALGVRATGQPSWAFFFNH